MTARAQRLGRSFIDPRSLVFWVGAGLVVYGLVHIVPELLRGVLVFPSAGVLASLLWAIYGIVFAVVVSRLELFNRRSPLTMLGAFVWGAAVVSGIAVIAAPAAHELVEKLLPASLGEDWVPAFAAPLVEEPLKMLGVVALAFIPGARINSPIDGLFFGLLVGLGFEISESLLYTVAGAATSGGSFTMVVLVFFLRGFVGGLWNHPTFTAITGAGVGYFFGSAASTAKRTAVLVGSLLAAMVLHGFFDSPLLSFSNPFVTSIVKGIPTLVLFIVVFRIAQARERSTFSAVGEANVPQDLISAGELETLSSRRARRAERRALRKQHGFAASHALKRLQRSQSELIERIDEEGAGSVGANEAAERVEEARAVLAQVTSA